MDSNMEFKKHIFKSLVHITMNKYFTFVITPKYPLSNFLKFYQNVRMKNTNLKNCQLQ
jgi:hypothetical protein